MIFVTCLTYGYNWNEVYYDEQKSLFLYKKYHCGTIDVSEDFFDGEEYVSNEVLLVALIQSNKLDIIHRYYDHLHGDALLDQVLAKINPFGSIRNGELLGNTMYEYYVFPDNQYIIYHHHNFYTVSEKQQCIPNFPAVKRIIENADRVVHYKYSHIESVWHKTLFATEQCTCS